jgi:hypothetical protein
MGGTVPLDAERSRAMSETREGFMVFKNEAGDYFLVPLATLAEGRVAEEHKAAVEQAVESAQSGAGENDAQGFILPALAVIAFGVGFNIGYTVGKDIRDRDSGEGGGMTNAQLIEQITGRPFPR